jgi:hypothetical protein
VKDVSVRVDFTLLFGCGLEISRHFFVLRSSSLLSAEGMLHVKCKVLLWKLSLDSEWRNLLPIDAINYTSSNTRSNIHHSLYLLLLT